MVLHAESLGEWLHNINAQYAKRDTKFVTSHGGDDVHVRYARKKRAVSWDDRFQQLVKCDRRHDNFGVPCHVVSKENDTSGDDSAGNFQETDKERYKFYIGFVSFVCVMSTGVR